MNPSELESKDDISMREPYRDFHKRIVGSSSALIEESSNDEWDMLNTLKVCILFLLLVTLLLNVQLKHLFFRFSTICP